MVVDINPIGIVFIFSTAIMLFLIIYFFFRTKKFDPVRLMLLAMSIIMFFWSFTNALVYNPGFWSFKVILFKMNTTGVFFIAPVELVFFRKYVGLSREFDLIDYMAFIPAIFLTVMFWSPLADLVYYNISTAYINGLAYMHFERGPLGYLHLAVLYGAYVVITIMLIKLYLASKNHIYRRNIILIYLAILIPIIPSFMSVIVTPDFWKVILAELPSAVYNVTLIIFILMTVDYNFLEYFPISFDLIGGSMSQPMAVLNSQKMMVYINPAMIFYMGLSSDDPENYFNQNIDDLIKDARYEFSKKLLEMTRDILDKIDVGGQNVFIKTCEISDGSINRSISIVVSDVRRGNYVLAYMVEYLDQTEEKLMEDTLMKRKHELEFYNDLLTHDMRNAIQIISASEEFLEMLEKDDIKRKYIMNINDSVHRINALMNNLKKLEELKSKKAAKSHVHLNKYLKDAARNLELTYPNHNLKIHLPMQDLYIQGDDLYYDLFWNLFQNSVKYAKGNNVTITVEASRVIHKGRKMVQIAITDRGIGIPDSEKNKVFNRYKRIMTKKEVQGSGLGLAIVGEIVDIHSGKVWVEDRVKGDYTKGCRFVILLPE